jgi:hypothetical protein
MKIVFIQMFKYISLLTMGILIGVMIGVNNEAAKHVVDCSKEVHNPGDVQTYCQIEYAKDASRVNAYGDASLFLLLISWSLFGLYSYIDYKRFQRGDVI